MAMLVARRVVLRGLSTLRFPRPPPRGLSQRPQGNFAFRDLLRLTRPDEDEDPLRLTRPDEDEWSCRVLPAPALAQTPPREGRISKPNGQPTALAASSNNPCLPWRLGPFIGRCVRAALSAAV